MLRKARQTLGALLIAGIKPDASDDFSCTRVDARNIDLCMSSAVTTLKDNKFIARVDKSGGKLVVLKPAAYTVIEEMAYDDREQISIAEALGINRHTFAEIRKRDPQAADALERGKARAMEDNVAKVKEHIAKGDKAALFFYLKSVHGLRDIGQPVHGQSPVHINITIPAKMAEDEVIKIIGTPPPEDADG